MIGSIRLLQIISSIRDFIKNHRDWLPEKFSLASLQEISSNIDSEELEIENLQKKKKIIETSIQNNKKEIKKLTDERQRINLQLNEKNAEKKKIENASNITQLGYNSIEDASQKLNITQNQYLIIPLNNNIENIEEIFNQKEELLIETNTEDGRVNIKECTKFNRQTAMATINSTFEYETIEAKAALIIPINEIDVRCIRKINADGTIQISQFELPQSTLLICQEFFEKCKDFDKFKTITAGKKLVEEIKQYLGDAYTEDKDELTYYDFIEKTNLRNNIDESERKKAIKNVIKDNYYEFSGNCIVNGSTNYISINSSKNIDENLTIEDGFFDNEIESIENYLFNDDGCIDLIYANLLRKLNEIYPKVKAQYNEEKNTSIQINGRNINIKPRLPSNSEAIYTRLTRNQEDISYKEMKVSMICNKFAHLLEKSSNIDKSLIDKFYSLKTELLKKIINESKNNSNINIGYVIDSVGMGIAMTIPGYSNILLHIVEGDKEMEDLWCSLENFKYPQGYNIFDNEFTNKFTNKSYGQPAIMIEGINQDLIRKILEIENFDTRVKILDELDIEVFIKFIVRLGIPLKEIATLEAKKECINKICTNEFLQNLLEKQQEIDDEVR